MIPSRRPTHLDVVPEKLGPSFTILVLHCNSGIIDYVEANPPNGMGEQHILAKSLIQKLGLAKHLSPTRQITPKKKISIPLWCRVLWKVVEKLKKINPPATKITLVSNTDTAARSSYTGVSKMHPERIDPIRRNETILINKKKQFPPRLGNSQVSRRAH
jgi:hypothetical protein